MQCCTGSIGSIPSIGVLNLWFPRYVRISDVYKIDYQSLQLCLIGILVNITEEDLRMPQIYQMASAIAEALPFYSILF